MYSVWPVSTAAGDVLHARTRGHADLAEGPTYFRCDGAPSGAPVVLLHGATVPHWEFDVLRPLLIATDHRVLSFDLYGHGHSARPLGPYTLERFARQTQDLVRALDFPRPFTLLGHSLGAAVAAAVAAERADWLTRLVLVAPMLDFNATSRWAQLLRVPLVGEAFMRVVGVPGLIRRRHSRYTRIGRPELIARFAAQARSPGYARALLSMVRSAALGDQGPRYAALARLVQEVVVVAGDADAVIPRAHIARVRALLPAHRYVEIAGAEHNLLLTHAAAVAAALTAR